jgi:hypothetical protein
MKHDRLLTIACLLSIVLMTVHVSDDVVRGFEPGGFKNLSGIALFVVFLCATLLPDARRWSYLVTLLGSALATVMPIAHMRGVGLAPVGATAGGHFFIWTLFSLGVTGMFGMILSVRGLWGLRRRAEPGAMPS